MRAAVAWAGTTALPRALRRSTREEGPSATRRRSGSSAGARPGYWARMRAHSAASPGAGGQGWGHSPPARPVGLGAVPACCCPSSRSLRGCSSPSPASAGCPPTVGVLPSRTSLEGSSSSSRLPSGAPRPRPEGDSPPVPPSPLSPDPGAPSSRGRSACSILESHPSALSRCASRPLSSCAARCRHCRPLSL